MPIDTIVGNPEAFKRSEDLDAYLENLRAYEAKYQCEAGILKMQNRQLGAIYYVYPKLEAETLLRKPITASTPEIPIKFYSIADLEKLQEALFSEKNSL